MSVATIEIRRRDPAVIAARAHHVLDAAARMHAQWPREGRKAIGETFVGLDAALEEYGTAADGDVDGAAMTAASAMALLLLSVSVFLGEAVADQMATDAAGITAGGDAGTKDFEGSGE